MALRVAVQEVCGVEPVERNSVVTAPDQASPRWVRHRAVRIPGPLQRSASQDNSLSGWQVAATFIVATALISQGLEWLRGGLDINPDVVAPAQYGPALAALVTWLVFRARMSEVMPTPSTIRQVRTRIMLAVAACVLFAVLLWAGYSVIGGQETYGIRAVHGVSFWTIALLWLVGAAAEEVGWRGVLQPALEKPLPRWGAGILTGLIWSLWHVPVISSGGSIAVVFIASTTVLSVLLAYLGNGSPAQRVITTSIAHWLMNLAILVVSGSRTDLAGLVSTLVAIGATTSTILMLLLLTQRRARTRVIAACSGPRQA